VHGPAASRRITTTGGEAYECHLSEFIAEQREGLVELMKSLRQARVKAAREAARSSASRIKC